ncbi:MAG TPA: AI-2E family transporter [Xanthobacteraceae bacterium]|nr:AI-2E family transporter [Xanthobacteraceae bacterium]
MSQRPARADNVPPAPGAEPAKTPLASRYIWDGMARGSVVGMFVLLLFAALHWAQPVVMPVVLALVVGIVLTPVLIQAAKIGIPYWVTALILVLLIFSGLSYALVLLAGPIGEWIEKAPELSTVLREKLRFLDSPIAAFNDLRESITGKAAEGQGGPNIDLFPLLVQPVLSVLTPALGQSVIFFATLLFFLSGREALRIRFLKFWGERKARLGALQFLKDIETSLAGYFGVITAINFVLGVLLAAVAWLVGLPSPLVWGILGFLLNFLPYIGPAVTIVMLLAVGLMVFESLLHALIAPVFYLAASIVEGEVITPSLVGMRLALSPLLVFLAVAFWTLFWGPFGALLAVPLLIIGTIALSYAYPQNEVKLPD